MTITDITVIVLLVISAANGAHQGFIRSLVGPTALVISLIASIFVYLATKNFSAAFLTALLGPFFLAWIIVTIIKKCLNTDAAPQVSAISRIGGQAVNLIWGSIAILLTVAFLAFFPFDRFDLPGISKDIRRSFTFRIVQPLFLNKALDKGTASAAPSGCLTDFCSTSEEDLQKLSADPAIQAIMTDPRIQKLQEDSALQKAIETRDYGAIINNPTVRELTQDPQFLLKAFKAYPKIQQLQAVETSNLSQKLQEAETKSPTQQP
jgi:hypothetical protein